MQGDLAVTGGADADNLLNTNPLALLLDILLVQQVQKRRCDSVVCHAGSISI